MDVERNGLTLQIQIAKFCQLPIPPQQRFHHHVIYYSFKCPLTAVDSRPVIILQVPQDRHAALFHGLGMIHLNFGLIQKGGTTSFNVRVLSQARTIYGCCAFLFSCPHFIIMYDVCRHDSGFEVNCEGSVHEFVIHSETAYLLIIMSGIGTTRSFLSISGWVAGAEFQRLNTQEGARKCSKTPNYM